MRRSGTSIRVRTRAASTVVCLLAFALQACSDPVDADCSTFSACGGDPTGEWVYREFCYRVVGVDLGERSCTEIFPDWSGLTVSGTLSLDPNGRYVRRSAVDGDITAAWSLSCEMPWSCEDASDPDEDIVCSVSGTDCSCRWPAGSGQIFEERGRWEASGSILEFEPDEFRSPSSPRYCVDGDVLLFESGGADYGQPVFGYGLVRR